MSERLVRTGALSWASLVALAAASPGQEPPRPVQIPSADAKSTAKLLESKSLDDPKAAAAAATFLEAAYEGQRPPEAVRMLAAVLRGSQMGPGDGWFGPAETRYSWKWFANRYGVDPAKGVVPRSQFQGPEAWFSRLDRNKDGAISADDLDWSDRNPYLQMSSMANRLFRKLNGGANGRLTKDELLQFFEKSAQGKDYLSADDFRDALLANSSPGSKPSDGPSTSVLIRGLFAGELGSMNEGPKLNEPAPHFTLKSAHGKDVVDLAKLIGPKPVVLVFGSFT